MATGRDPDEEDLPDDFFDDFSTAEFMQGLKMGKKNKPTEEDLRDLLRSRKEEAAREHRNSRECRPAERRHRSRSPIRKREDHYTERGSRRDVDKTNRDIKKDKESKVKEYLAKRLGAEGDEVPPGTELDDYYEMKRRHSPPPLRLKPRRPSISPLHGRRSSVSPHRNQRSSFSPHRDRRNQRPHMPARHPSRRQRTPSPSPPLHHYNHLPHSGPHSRSRRSRSRSRPRRSSSRQRRSSSRQRRSSSRHRRSREHHDEFLYQSHRPAFPPNEPRPGGFPPSDAYGPPVGYPPQSYPEGYYPPPMAEPQPSYYQGPNYNYGAPLGGPGSMGMMPQMACPPMGGSPMGGSPMEVSQMGGLPMGAAGIAHAAPYGYDPTPPPVLPAPQPVPPPVPTMVPQAALTSVSPATSQLSDSLERMLADGKISKQDYLKLTPKGRVTSEALQEKVETLKRCTEAVAALAKLHLPNRLIMNSKFTVPEQKAIVSKFCSPLKRQPAVIFNFTSSKTSALHSQNKQLVDSIVNTIGLKEVVTKTAKKKDASKFKDASVQTTTPFCENCEIRQLTKYNQKGTEVDRDHFSTSVHSQVIEVDLASSKSMFTPGGNISEGGSMSLSHLTPAQLIVSQLAARAKKLETTSGDSPDSDQYMRRQRGNSQNSFYAQQNHGRNQYENNWY